VDTQLSSDAQMWSLVVAFFLPVAIAVIQRQAFSSALRATITFLVSGVAAAGTAYFTDGLTGGNLIHSGLIILVGTIAVYQGLMKPTGIAPAVEAATGGGRSGP